MIVFWKDWELNPNNNKSNNNMNNNNLNNYSNNLNNQVWMTPQNRQNLLI